MKTKTAYTRNCINVLFPFTVQTWLMCKCFGVKKSNMGLSARKPLIGVCEQQRLIPACESALTDQRLCYAPFEKYYIQYKLATRELVSVAEDKGLSLTLSETPKIDFVASRLNNN